MKKVYVTWTPLVFNRHHVMHPDDAVKRLWTDRGNVFKFTPLGVGDTKDDARRLGVLEYDETKVKQEVIDRFINNFSMFGMMIVETPKAVSLANEWYPNPEKKINPLAKDYFKLDEKDSFSLVDDRPKKDFDDSIDIKPKKKISEEQKWL